MVGLLASLPVLAGPHSAIGGGGARIIHTWDTMDGSMDAGECMGTVHGGGTRQCNPDASWYAPMRFTIQKILGLRAVHGSGQYWGGAGQADTTCDIDLIVNDVTVITDLFVVGVETPTEEKHILKTRGDSALLDVDDLVIEVGDDVQFKFTEPTTPLCADAPACTCDGQPGSFTISLVGR
jgi:hypothetical protein